MLNLPSPALRKKWSWVYRNTHMAEEQFVYQDLLEYIVKGLVDHPDDVGVERRVDEMGVLLILKVHPEDMGQIIGRQGSTARAIRTLVRIAGLKAHARVNLKIEEPEGGRQPRESQQRESQEEVKIESSSLEDLTI